MKIILIMPKASIKGLPYDISIGMGSLSAVLKRAGHSVLLLNLNHYDSSTEELAHAIKSYQPDVIGTGGMSFSYPLLQKYLRLAKATCPDAKTIVGGMVVTSQPDVVFNGLGADVAVIGEAEETIVELMDAFSGNRDLASVKGIIYQDEKTDALVTTPPRPLIQDLDSLPWPDYEGMEMDKFVNLRGNTDDGGLLFSHHDSPRMIPIMTSRGCPFKCTFCCYELVETKYRTRSLDNVMAEIEYLVDRFKINTLFISDDLFSLKKSRMIEFCERIKPLNLNWTCSIRVKPLDREQLILMRDSGCKAVGFGIESASPDVLMSMKKKITVADIDEALKTTHEVGIGIGGNLIFGDPAETRETVMESLKWFTDNPQYIIRISMVGYHPGTVIYRDALARGLIEDKIEYLEKSEFEINGTEIPDDAYTKLGPFLRLFNSNIGITGKITSVTEQGNGLMTLETKCPHCQAPGTYKKVYKRLGKISWISCRSCNRRHKLPLCVVEDIIPAFSDIFEHPSVESDAEKLQAYLKIANQPSPHYSALFELGKLYLEADELGKALHYLGASLNINPNNPDYHHQYAEANRRAGKEDFARIHEAQAQMLEDAGVENTIYVAVDVELDAFVQKGLRAHKDGKLEDAEAIYRKALLVNPDHSDANHSLGVIAFQAGMLEESLELISKAIVINSENALYHYNLGNTLQALDRSKEAIASHQNALSINPALNESHHSLGNLRREQGNPTEP